MLWVMPISQALKEAEDRKLDLVEVSPKAQPPVCKIMDFGQFLYQQKKIDQQNKKKQKKTEVKEIRLGCRIWEHDLQVREKQARKFIDGRNIVKVTMIFKWREKAYTDIGMAKVKEFADILSDVAKIDKEPVFNINKIVMTLISKK